MREVSTTHIRNNIGAVSNAVLGGETLTVVRGTKTGKHIVGYMVPPKLFPTLVELDDDLRLPIEAAAQEQDIGISEVVNRTLRAYIEAVRTGRMPKATKG